MTSSDSKPRCTTGSRRIDWATPCMPAISQPKWRRVPPSGSRTNRRSRSSTVRSHVLAGAPATSERDRVEARLRLAHGRADFVASRNSEGIAQLYRAADLAESAGDPATLAEAALVASLNRRHGLDDPELLRLLERASAVCPPEPAVLPAMLHIRQSRLLPNTVRHEERSAMARLGLVDVALMDPVDRATVETEVARACWSPDDAHEREALTTRHIDGGDAANSRSEASRVGPAC